MIRMRLNLKTTKWSRMVKNEKRTVAAILAGTALSHGIKAGGYLDRFGIPGSENSSVVAAILAVGAALLWYSPNDK